MNKDEKCTIIEKYVNGYNNFDIDEMLSVIHPEVEFVNISGGEINASASGIDEFRDMAEDSKKYFSSRKQTIIDFKEKDDQVAIEVEYEGVLAVDLPNGKKAGETMRLNGLSEFTLLNGMIYRIVDIS
ncbi:MAG: nuclear transport factor 2 family protein [Ignavibacterium sp.]|nr:MAG: nuclear transport factor 2 family protein [Ignavibacterium sp.]